MNFIVLTQYFPPEVGASQTRLAAFARCLRIRGHRVEVVTAMPHHLTGRVFPQYRGHFYLRESFDGMPLHRTWVYAATGTGLKRLVNYFSFCVSSMFGLLKCQRADYVFVESPPLFLGLTGHLISGIRHTPMIFNIADLWPESIAELGLMRRGTMFRLLERFEHWVYRKARFINAVTDGIAQALLEKKGIEPQKLLFLPNGVDTDFFCPRTPDHELIEQLGLAGKDIILYAGTHGVAQGLETLVQAAYILKGSNIAFVFVGEGHRKAALQRLVLNLELDNVRFVDPQPLGEMPRIYSIAYGSIVPLVKADLFKGARPSKIFISLASGVPVIYSGEGEAATLINRNNVGLVAPPEDPQALADAVLLLASDRNLRNRMSENARALAVREHDWSMIVDRWLASLELMMNHES